MAVAVRQGQEGSRWYNARPSGEELAEWFREVDLHEGLLHRDYIGGIVLIQSKEKSKDIDGFDAKGRPNIVEREDLVYVPYVKVDTRVAYFWNWIDKMGYVGEINPVPLAEGTETIGLPPGFFRYQARKPGASSDVVNFVGCSMRVTILTGERELIVRQPPPGSKAVATSTKWDVDENALMKAETGAIGRALGMAGMLVIPGSGVATAEDMQEALYDPPAGAVPEAAELPAPVQAIQDLSDAQLREHAAELVEQLPEDKREAFQEWARGRKLTLDSAQGAALRGVVKKLERTLADAS